MIDEHGADATRYGLLKISSTQDVRFSSGAIEEGRKLANKLWNVSRLILQNAEGVAAVRSSRQALEERWILARIDAARAQVEEAWAAFDFATASNVLYHLTFDDFCDWYAEAVKPRLYEHEPSATATALAALERLLALLHPMLPHVTEEIWSYLPARSARLIVSPWPEPDDRFGADADALARVQDAAVTFRRSGVQVDARLGRRATDFRRRRPPGAPEGTGDAAAEIARLQKEIARAEAMLANDRFVENAPADVVAAERDKLDAVPAASSRRSHEHRGPEERPLTGVRDGRCASIEPVDARATESRRRAGLDERPPMAIETWLAS